MGICAALVALFVIVRQRHVCVAPEATRMGDFGGEMYENSGPEGRRAGAPWRLHVISSPRMHDIAFDDVDGAGEQEALEMRRQVRSGGTAR